VGNGFGVDDPSERSPAAAPPAEAVSASVVPPPQVRFCVWFDWAAACFMLGLALGQLGQDWSSRADLRFQAVAIPVFLALGEGLRRRAWWARVPQLLLSAGLTIPVVLALGRLVRHGHLPVGINAVVGGVILVSAGAAVQLSLLLLPSSWRWMKDPRPGRVGPWALLLLAAPAFGVGLGLQALMASNGWSARVYDDLGIRIRMPEVTMEKVEQRRDDLGDPYDAHVLLARGRRCTYAVRLGRLPARAGGSWDPAAWRADLIGRMTTGTEIVSRALVAAEGRFGVGGEEVRFRQDRVAHTARVYAPLPRFIVMLKSCYPREGPEADGFFDSLAVEPR
jgi:hypothetical protein